MKLFSYKPILAKRRYLIYVVLLLFFYSVINYKHISNVLQAVVDKWRNERHSSQFSTEGTRTILVSADSREYQRKQRNAWKSDGISLQKNDVVTSNKDFSNIDNVGDETSIETLVDNITFNIAETLDESYRKIQNGSYQTCSTIDEIGNSCEIGSCLQMQLPSDLRTRVEQIVAPSHLQLSFEVRRFLSLMADKVPGYFDFILVSGVSYSHFEEAQAMLYNIHTHLFPHLHNFTFIYYNLGLTKEQRSVIAKICKCHLIDFPFELFPEFVAFLKCYAWKPLIVNAHISRTKLLFWIDASVRFKKHSIKTIDLLNRAHHRGIQVFTSKQSIARVTLPSMFHFFGDEACVYANVSVILSGVVLFHNTMFVKRAILEPWTACAMNTNCMCPENVNLREVRVACHNETEKNYYGTCHRFDQSALSIILVKIYQHHMDNILAPMSEYLDIKRADKMVYPIKENIGINRD